MKILFQKKNLDDLFEQIDDYKSDIIKLKNKINHYEKGLLDVIDDNDIDNDQTEILCKINTNELCEKQFLILVKLVLQQ